MSGTSDGVDIDELILSARRLISSLQEAIEGKERAITRLRKQKHRLEAELEQVEIQTLRVESQGHYLRLEETQLCQDLQGFRDIIIQKMKGQTAQEGGNE